MNLNEHREEMNLNESIVEEAALTWFGELGCSIGHGPLMASGETAAERDTFGDVVLAGRLRVELSVDFGAEVMGAGA